MSYLNFDEIRTIADSYGETNDCTVIALSQACSVSYEKAHNILRHLGRKPRKGFLMEKVLDAAMGLGFTVESTKLFGNTVGRLRIPRDKIFLIETSCHVFAARDGKSLDYTKGRRHKPLHFWELNKTGKSIFDHIPEKVIGVGYARQQRKWKYCCSKGCEFEVSTTKHNKITRGALYRCKKHREVIFRKDSKPNGSVKPKRPSWIKIEES